MALSAGANDLQALAAARAFYQRFFERTLPTLVQTDRADVVAEFARDWNATQGF